VHIQKIGIDTDKFPTQDYYPFNLPIIQNTHFIELSSPISFFIGENGTGKSTILKAISEKCGIYMWEDNLRSRYDKNPYEKVLFKALEIHWTNGIVPGSFFAAEIFQHFSQILDELAKTDAGILDYFGGKSLMSQSHGQSLISFFKSRYKIKGLYLLDEPETALSPKSQLELVKIIARMSEAGHAQFIVATHSPILLACPGASILNFNTIPIQPIDYELTEYYQVYKDFLNNRSRYL